MRRRPEATARACRELGSTASMTPRAVDRPRRCRNLHTLDERANLRGDLAGDRQPFLRRAPVGIRAAHPLDARSGTRTPGTSLAMNSACRALSSGMIAGEDRNRVRRRSRSRKALNSRDVEHRLRDRELGPRLDLVREAAQLFVRGRAPPGLTATPMWNAVGWPMGWPPMSSAAFSRATTLARPIESTSNDRRRVRDSRRPAADRR